MTNLNFGPAYILERGILDAAITQFYCRLVPAGRSFAFRQWSRELELREGVMNVLRAFKTEIAFVIQRASGQNLRNFYHRRILSGESAATRNLQPKLGLALQRYGGSPRGFREMQRKRSWLNRPDNLTWLSGGSINGCVVYG